MRRRSEVVQHLADVPLFSACSKRDLQIVARHTEEGSVPAGTALVEEGGPGDAFFVIVDGDATVRRGGRKVGGLGPGDYFGELALLDAAPRNATVEAESDVTVAVLGARSFAALLHELPDLSDKLLRSMARRLREADARTVQ